MRNTGLRLVFGFDHTYLANGCVTADRYAGGFDALARVLKEKSTFKGGSALAWVLRISAAAAVLFVTAFPTSMWIALALIP
jgi:predicted transcriptional regulator of viral defense system